MITARSTPNIALIKYWGNRDEELRLPTADSLSMTLDSPSVEISVEPADVFSVRSFNVDSSERELSAKQLERFRKHFALTCQYMDALNVTEAFPDMVAITIHSEIPPSIGLASSSAVFSALAECYGGLIAEQAHATLDRTQISAIARLGSGSAARGVYGGFVALVNAESVSADGAYAKQIALESHWNLHDIIVVPGQEEKKVGSTEGHAGVATSPLFADRVHAIPRRMEECTDAILKRDFEKLQHVAEEDCWNMHEVMKTQNPPLHYLSEETQRITKEIDALRSEERIPVFFTMDAGPTVHLFCTDEGVKPIKEYAHTQRGCSVFETKIGGGSHLL